MGRDGDSFLTLGESNVENLLGELCGLACTLSHALRSSISRRNVEAGTIEVLHRSNSGIPNTHPIKYAIPKVGPNCPVFLVPDVSTEPALSSLIQREIFPNLRSLAAYWLGNIDHKDHFLIIWNPPARYFSSNSEQLAIDHIVTIISQTLLEQKTQVADTKNQTVFEQPASVFPTSSGGAATRFLIDTLVQKQRLLVRNGASYVALRQWRKNIKPYQISALSALKSYSDDHIEDEVANEMSTAIKRVYGDAFAHIVPIPSGSSGIEDGLSKKLARRIAKLLNAKYNDVLAASPVTKGSSHPIKSASLKPYKIDGSISGNVLIVDDVATSGKHIELATKAIRPLATYCASVVWIAD